MMRKSQSFENLELRVLSRGKNKCKRPKFGTKFT
jgi:hypothetical protein